MSVQLYGIKYTCDCCGAQGAVDDRYPVVAIQYNQIPVPEGWTNMGLFSLMMTDAYGAAINHLCQVCGGLSIGGLTERLKARAERERVRT
jgi:hypothetical protein